VNRPEFKLMAVYAPDTCRAGKCSNGADCPEASHGKHAVERASGGFSFTARTPEELAQMFPGSNLGVITGIPSGAFVLDLDGAGAMAWWEGQQQLNPVSTLSVETGRGRHLYFRMPDGLDVRNDAELVTGLRDPATDKPAWQVDVRGTGGYVVAPPSVHRSGRTYEWTEAPLADAPRWVLDLVKAGGARKREKVKPADVPVASPEHQQKARQRIGGWLETLGNTTSGRNNTTNRAACSIGGYAVHLPEEEHEDVLERILETVRSIHPQAETDRDEKRKLAKNLDTAERAFADGMAQPLDLAADEIPGWLEKKNERSVLDMSDPDPDLNAPVNLDGLEGSARTFPLRRALRKVIDRVDDALRVTDPEEFVREWIRRTGHSYDYSRDGFLTPERFAANLDLLARSIELDRDRLHVKGLSQRAIESSLQLLRPVEERLFLESLRKRLAFDPACQGAVRKFIHAVTGEERELDLAVLLHFIWQMKRKLNGLPVTDHLMAVFQGKTRAGKSTALLRLFEPVREVLSSFLGLDVLQDERQVFRLARSYVVFLDEMGKAPKVSVDTLKNVITRPELEWRKLGTNTIERAVNNVTLIGASNPRLSELIADPTGMRRFYEVQCQDVLDWETVNAFDPLACWREVDERKASPLGPHVLRLGEIQNTELVVDPFTEWAEEHLEPSTTPSSPAKLYVGSVSGRSYADRFRAQNYGARVTQLSERQFRERLKVWANDPARLWFRPGRPLAYRKDSSGDMRVWLELRREDTAAARKPLAAANDDSEAA
jgi:hypothetical protein